jgi:hypothetical protein
MSARENIQVCCRFRPPNAVEKESASGGGEVVKFVDASTLSVMKPADKYDRSESMGLHSVCINVHMRVVCVCVCVCVYVLCCLLSLSFTLSPPFNFFLRSMAHSHPLLTCPPPLPSPPPPILHTPSRKHLMRSEHDFISILYFNLQTHRKMFSMQLQIPWSKRSYQATIVQSLHMVKLGLVKHIQ